MIDETVWCWLFDGIFFLFRTREHTEPETNKTKAVFRYLYDIDQWHAVKHDISSAFFSNSTEGERKRTYFHVIISK